ncbi:hypothetical protein ACJX0J_042401 [Zea mays]
MVKSAVRQDFGVFTISPLVNTGFSVNWNDNKKCVLFRGIYCLYVFALPIALGNRDSESVALILSLSHTLLIPNNRLLTEFVLYLDPREPLALVKRTYLLVLYGYLNDRAVVKPYLLTRLLTTSKLLYELLWESPFQSDRFRDRFTP